MSACAVKRHELKEEGKSHEEEEESGKAVLIYSRSLENSTLLLE